MTIQIRIRSPRRWKRNYLVDALRNRNIKGVNFSKNIPKDTTILVTNYLSSEELKSAKNLRYLIIPTAGIEGICMDEIQKRGIKVFHDSSITAKGVVNYINDNLKKVYSQNLKKELKNKIVGLLGDGTLAKLIGKSFKKYNIKLLNFKRKDDNKKLNRLLIKSDILINTLPLNGETENLLSNRTDYLKKGCIVISVSRAGILEDKKILEAVLDNRLGGAILDVYDPKINPADYNSDKMLLTPHIAGIYGRALGNLVKFIESSIFKSLARQKLVQFRSKF